MQLNFLLCTIYSTYSNFQWTIKLKIYGAKGAVILASIIAAMRIGGILQLQEEYRIFNLK